MSLGPLEILLIVVVIALLFGAKKLPELMKGMGQGVREFRSEVGDRSRPDPLSVTPPVVELQSLPTELGRSEAAAQTQTAVAQPVTDRR